MIFRQTSGEQGGSEEEKDIFESHLVFVAAGVELSIGR